MQAFELASKSPKLEETFGAPLQRAYVQPFSGSIRERFAKVKISVSGPKAKGFLHCNAMSSADGAWQIVALAAELEGDQQFDKFGAPRYQELLWEGEEGEDQSLAAGTKPEGSPADPKELLVPGASKE